MYLNQNRDWYEVEHEHNLLWVKKKGGIILEIQKIEDDFCLFDVTKGRKLLAEKSKYAYAKSYGNHYLKKRLRQLCTSS